MIIVEGGDNVGKTTTVDRLLEINPEFHLLRRKRFNPNQGETIGLSYIQSLLPQDGDRVRHGLGVADRLLASECIYGELFRQGCRMSPAEHFIIKQLLVSYSTIVIHCNTPDEVILESWKDRPQLYDDPLNIVRAYRSRIREVFKGVTVIDYDWTKDNLRKIVSVYTESQNRRSRHLSWWSANPYGVGQVDNPSLILIGDTLGPRAVLPVPFLSGPAGDFLAWTLEELCKTRYWLRNSTYITNARKRTTRDPSILREELSHLIGSSTVVIAMGRNSQKMYRQVQDSLPHRPSSYGEVPHPMFWRRFKYKERSEYVKMFHDIMGVGQ